MSEVDSQSRHSSPDTVLCPLCLGRGTYPAKINDRKRGCYKGLAECPCCEGRKMVSRAEQQAWSQKYG